LKEIFRSNILPDQEAIMHLRNLLAVKEDKLVEIQANCQQLIPGTTNDGDITSEEET